MPITLKRADKSFADGMNETGRRAFSDDGWQLAIFPERLRDPNDPGAKEKFMTERMRARLTDDGVFCIVATDEAIKDEQGNPRVMGYASWHAPGRGENAEEDGPSGEDDRAEQKDGWVDDGQGGKRGDGKKYPACMDVEAWWRVDEILKQTKTEILGSAAPNVWFLGSLAIDPEFKGRGIASQLVEWGIDKIEEDGVPGYLESTVAAKNLYARLGFEAIKEMPTIEDGGRPHTAMLRKPKTSKA